MIAANYLISIGMATGFLASLWIARETEGRRGLLLVAALFGVFLILMIPGVMGQSSQVAHPIETFSAGSWTAVGMATLHEATDEISPNDAVDYITSSATPDTAILTLATMENPPFDNNHTIRLRAESSGGGTKMLQAQLRYNGVVIGITPIWSVSGTWTTFEYTFPTAQISMIPNYSNLSVAVIHTNAGTINISQIEFEISGIVEPVLASDFLTLALIGIATWLLPAIAGFGAKNGWLIIISAIVGFIFGSWLILEIGTGIFPIFAIFTVSIFLLIIGTFTILEDRK